MDNLENYLYILFAIIYIISRVIKARSKQQKENTNRPSQQGQARQARDQRQQVPPQRKKAFSFEDILKEFEKNLGGEEEFEKPLPVKEIKHQKPTPVVEAQKPQKKNPFEAYEGSEYVSTDDVQGKKEETIFSRDDNYSIKGNVASEYVKMLRDPQGFKNAIVLSEIINRKYF